MAGLYIHIPFCKTRCIYCDFFSTTQNDRKDAYVKALCREMQLRKDFAGGERISTIYIGGGTPSQLTHAQIEYIIYNIYKVYDVEDGCEFTLEANPDDVSEAFVRFLTREGGQRINRLSMGVQTFDDRRLRFLHRRHTSTQAADAVRRCQDKGITNISIDLMHGFPGQTIEEWTKDIDIALNLSTPHISAYSLMYEEGTKLTQMLQRGEIEDISEESSADMYRLLRDRLTEHGYQHYEISNFCKPGYHSRHNSSYWHGIPYIGIGAGAHSYDGNTRSSGIADIESYMTGISRGVPDMIIEHLTDSEKYNEAVMTGLRTSEGININDIEKKFGTTAREYCIEAATEHIRSGNLLFNDEEGTLRLSHDGIMISNVVMSDMMMVEVRG